MIDFIKVFYRSDQSHDRISYSIVLFQKKKNTSQSLSQHQQETGASQVKNKTINIQSKHT